MPLLPLVGHHAFRARVHAALERGSLPATLLLQGPAGAGKERLAVWMAERLLCGSPTAEGAPCGACQHCSYVARGVHPDLLWFFPRPRPKDPKPEPDEVVEEFAGAVAERAEAGHWTPPDPTDALYVATVRAIVQRATLTPALARRKIIVVGDAHRLVSQESSEEAANAFLKLLEEPLEDTTIILTTSFPAALLPTIRSRAVTVRVAPLSGDDIARLAALGVRPPGRGSARAAAAALLEAAGRDATARYRAAFTHGAAGARGAFADSLDALISLLYERSRTSAARGDERAAANAARGMDLVERTKVLTRQNVNPQLLTVTLLDDLAPLLS